MTKEIINQLVQAKTRDEILYYKKQLMDLQDELYKEINSETLSITNYNDIKMLHDLGFPMAAYYGPQCNFIGECGIPFLEQHNPKTLTVLNFIVVFYSLLVLELIERGFYNDAELCIYENVTDDVFHHIEKMDLTKFGFNRPFTALWYFFMQVITIEDNTCEFSLEYDFKQYIFYLSSDKNEELLDLIYKIFDNSKFQDVIDRILGIYRLRFTKMKYILEYQPMFVNVAYNYLCTLVETPENK